MKLNIPVIADGCLVFLATGCNKQLDRLPLDSPSSASFYNDATEVELGVLGCYKSLTSALEVFAICASSTVSTLVTSGTPPNSSVSMA